MPRDILRQQVKTMTEAANDFERAEADLVKLETQLSNVIIGQEKLLRDLLTALFAGGHVLLEGLPGLGKTHLAKAVSALLDLQAGRIQCTPDLLPSDITGSEVLSHESNTRNEFEFRKGPLFANLVLVDEINRATPRTQAALLEAMQERQVSYNGTQHILPNPFRVIATQNPIELEGTFPLPEAQLDRFMLKLHVPYPAADRLGEILDATLDREPADELQVVCTIERMLEIQSTAQQVLVSEDVRSSAVDLILATQADSENGVTRRHIRYGASPRALQSLVRAARVRALIGGRAHVAPEDLAHLALPVLRHRILLRSESELDGNTPDSVLSEIVAAWSETYV
jgi:MoxR-like ATPase